MLVPPWTSTACAGCPLGATLSTTAPWVVARPAMLPPSRTPWLPSVLVSRDQGAAPEPGLTHIPAATLPPGAVLPTSTTPEPTPTPATTQAPTTSSESSETAATSSSSSTVGGNPLYPVSSSNSQIARDLEHLSDRRHLGHLDGTIDDAGNLDNRAHQGSLQHVGRPGGNQLGSCREQERWPHRSR